MGTGKQTVVLYYLRTLWRRGALQGATKEEAFPVSVGHRTMTADDILYGRLIIEIGIAPVRPAEFVFFRDGLHCLRYELPAISR